MKLPAIYCYPGLVMVFSLTLVLTMTLSCPADEVDVWIGTNDAEGIFHLTLDTEKGKLSKPKVAVKIPGAGFLALHPDGKTLYATAKQNNESGVAAFEILTNLNLPNQAPLETRTKQQKQLPKQSTRLKPAGFLPTGDGGATCISVDETGKTLASAQYGGGSVSTYTIKSDGSLGERVEVIEHGPGSGVNKKRQSKSHPHWVGTSPGNRFLMVPDLGLDQVVVYEIDSETAKLQPHSKVAVPPGSGPRHMKFHTSGKYAFVLNELKLTISVFKFDAVTGAFENIQLIETLPEELKDKHLNSAAEIRVHPSGRFVYSSNRGHDSVTVFAVDQETGELTFVERESIRGSWPRNFNIDPTGKWLIAAGQRSNTLSLFEIEQDTGELVSTRNIVNVPAPICVMFGRQQ